MSENRKLYDALRVCPSEAQRPIQAGKLRGKTDISPQWRLQMLTEVFGPCGVGWKIDVEDYWTTPGANGEVAAWCRLSLYYRDPDTGKWSEGVSGIGGSMLVDTQKGKLATNDDAFKMAHTDAISVACKALGMAADIYWSEGSTKYDRAAESAGEGAVPQNRPQRVETITCTVCGKPVGPVKSGGKVYSPAEIREASQNTYGHCMCWACMKEAKAKEAEGDAAGF